MSIKKYHNVYFLGIGGIGMSALARWFRHLGMRVAGYDRTATVLTRSLEAEGMDIHYIDEVTQIPEWVYDAENTLIVYTPAIPANHKEKQHLLQKGLSLHKRSQVLGMLTKDKHTIAVAGTHGKTTTSSMIAHILMEANKNCVAFLGGIMQGYESNLLMSKSADEHATVVVEADEFDRSFLTLYPDVAVVTSTDADHLDIYQDHNQLKASFKAFVSQIRAGGNLIVQEKIAHQFNEAEASKSYGIDSGLYQAVNVTSAESAFHFDYKGAEHIKGLELHVPGFHNVENATAAITSALLTGVSAEDIKKAIASYRGVKRRFEYVVNNTSHVYIDDYAHHPVEIEALMKSVRALYPHKKVTAIFQPHLFSRTKDFAEAFARSLDEADEVWLLPIYPARELPIPGVTSELILNNMALSNKCLVADNELIDKVKKEKPEVLLTVGAGDIDRFPQQIKEVLHG